MRTQVKLLAISIFSIGLSTWVYAQPILVNNYKNIEEYKLDNGLKVILSENKKANKIYMNTVYFTGSLNDPTTKGGLAHLLEHLSFKGTKNIPQEKYQQQLDQFTLMNNASTDYYTTQYINEMSPNSKALKEIILLESERMSNLVLQQKYIPTELEIVKRERELSLDNSFSILIDNIFNSIYGYESLGREPIGNLQDLDSITIDELKKYYETWYAPNNAAIVITGNFNKKDALEAVEQYFGTKKTKLLPEVGSVKPIELNKAQAQSITVKKGDGYADVLVYLTPRNIVNESSLILAPLLYTLEPSGHLFKNLVDTGIADDVEMSGWNTADFNMMYISADYAAGKNFKKISDALLDGIQKTSPFTDEELRRVKTILTKDLESTFKDASDLGETIVDSLVLNQGNWVNYFQQQDQIQSLKVEDVNEIFKNYFITNNRLEASIEPTDITEKNSVENNSFEALNDKSRNVKYKDISIYKKETDKFSKATQTSLLEIEKNINKGQLKNGAKYTFYNVETVDDQVYANINLNFGTVKSLIDKKYIIDLTSYLMMRGSNKYSLQDITDRGIEANGDVVITNEFNSINIKISSDKDSFESYLQFILELIQTPKFEDQQFNLIQTRAFNNLDKSYTQPDKVTQLLKDQLSNHYDHGDIRIKDLPEVEKLQLKQVDLNQINTFYQKYVNASHANIVITGTFNNNKVQKILNDNLGQWNGTELYEPIEKTYVPAKSQKHYLSAEPSATGSYNAFIDMPISSESADLPAVVVMSYILGESQLSSRLGQELREKNALVYGFTQSLESNEKIKSGRLNINANYTVGNAELVSNAVKKVLSEFIEKGVTDQEVESAKATILMQASSIFKNPENIQTILIPQLKFDHNISELNVNYLKLAKLNKNDINQVIKKYIDMNYFVEIMADQNGKDK